MGRDGSIGAKLWSTAVWVVVGFFVLNLFAYDRDGRRQFLRNPLARHVAAGRPHQRGGISAAWPRVPASLRADRDSSRSLARSCSFLGLLGVPAAYALARREFPGKRACDAALPAADPGAADDLRHPARHGALPGPVSAARSGASSWQTSCPRCPFVILVMIPFIEQIDPFARARRRASSVPERSGCSSTSWCRRSIPGVLAALLLVLVRTMAMFELTFSPPGRPARRSWLCSTMRCSPPAFARCNRSTRWPWSIW